MFRTEKKRTAARLYEEVEEGGESGARAEARDEAEGGRSKEGRRGGGTPSTKVRGGEEGSPWKKRKLARRRSAREKAEKGEREKARGEGGGGKEE